MQAATVLVVEDNPFTRKVVERALRRDGYQVVVVENGRSAVEQMSVCHPQVVLQDIALGDSDGRALLHELRKLAKPDARFVAFTGSGEVDELREAGFDDVLLKPVGVSELTSVVAAHARGEASDHKHKAADVWAALMAMLAQMAELSRERTTRDELEPAILASVLHTCGLSVGFSFGVTNGKLLTRAQVGIPTRARGLAADWAAHPACVEVMRTQRPALVHRDRDPSLFDCTGIASILLIPLCARDEATAVLAIGSTRPLASTWLHFAGTIGGPLALTLQLAETIAQLATSEQRLRSITGSTADGILLADGNGKVSYANPAAERMFAQPLTGADVKSLLRDKPKLESSVRSFEDPPGQLNWVYVVRDVSDRQRIVELESLATRDALTGLYNRRRFDEELASRIASSRRHRQPGSVLLIDLDRFKPINDSYGHAAGDALLMAVAKAFAANVRTSDLVARLGGDEFAIVLDHTGRDGAEHCASKLLSCIESLAVPWPGAALTVGCSIGIATFPEASDDAEAVLARADDALYRAKRDGRGVAR